MNYELYPSQEPNGSIRYTLKTQNEYMGHIILRPNNTVEYIATNQEFLRQGIARTLVEMIVSVRKKLIVHHKEVYDLRAKQFWHTMQKQNLIQFK